ncbi:MAG: hypothetical protein ACRCV6_07165, partial [Formosimonas sp.]
MFIFNKTSMRRSLCVASIATASLLQTACYVSPVNGGLEYKFGLRPQPGWSNQAVPADSNLWPEISKGYTNRETGQFIGYRDKQFGQFSIYTNDFKNFGKVQPSYTLERIGEVSGRPVTNLAQFEGVSGSRIREYLINGKLSYLMYKEDFSPARGGIEFIAKTGHTPPPQGRYRLTLESPNDSYITVKRSKDNENGPIEKVYTTVPQTIELDIIAGERTFVRIDFTEEPAKRHLNWHLKPVSYAQA